MAESGPSDAIARVETAPASSTNVAWEAASLRVLCVLELLDNILSFLDRSDNARNAQVCKTWSGIALKVVWEEVDDLVALFSILSPMVAGAQPERQNIYDFVRIPSTTSWRRFETYAMLVRKLVYTPSDPSEDVSKNQISRAVLRDIGQTRTRLVIFPNMHTLTWVPAQYDNNMNSSITSIPSDCFLFLHSGVRYAEFFLQKAISPLRTKHFLDDIPLRSPLLTELTIRGTVTVSLIEESIRGLVKSLPSLEKIAMPEGYLTSRIAEELSTLPALRRIKIGVHGDVFAEPLPVTHFAPVIPVGRFTALEKLTGTMTFSDAAKVLDRVSRENGVSHVFIDSTNSSCEDMCRVVDICAQKHKWIDELDLVCDDDESENTPITVKTLRSLKQLSSLTILTIQHMSPILLSLAELTPIITSLPRLSELCLNPEPRYCETATFGLEIIPIIAQNCRNLTKLELFLDATIPLAETESYLKEDCFSELEWISFGVSVITKETCHSSALYLSSHIPPECEILYGGHWVATADDIVDDAQEERSERVRIAKERLKLWGEVNNLVQFSEKVRMQERGRVAVS